MAKRLQSAIVTFQTYELGHNYSLHLFSCGYTHSTERSRWPSLLWTEWRTRLMWYHAHALNVRVDLGGPVAALDRKESEAVSTERWADRFVLMAVTRRGRSSSQLASGLAESRSLTMQTGCHLIFPLSNVAGSLTLALRSRVSYTLPASRTWSSAARRCYSPRSGLLETGT
jgi:hypothetical protein